jgi:hypothetical protein
MSTKPQLLTNLVPKAPSAAPEKPKVFVEREVDLTLEQVYCPSEGEHRSCTVRSVILGLEGRREVARMLAVLSNSQPWNLLPPAEMSYFYMLATVVAQLKDMPEWLILVLQEDEDKLSRVYEFCMAHNARYLRGIGGTGEAAEDPAGFRLSSTMPDIAPKVKEPPVSP